MLRAAAFTALWLTVAVAFGLAIQLGDQMPGTPHMAMSLGAPWLLFAFAAGVTTRTAARGAALGALALGLATAAYYAVYVRAAGRDSLFYATAMTIGWGAAAATAGALFGAAGARFRHTRSSWAAALPGAALIAEAFVLSAQPHFDHASRLLTLEALAGVLAWLALAPRRIHVTVATGVLLVVPLALAADGLRDTLRAAGWNGA